MGACVASVSFLTTDLEELTSNTKFATADAK
jgi:hypothetical protein